MIETRGRFDDWLDTTLAEYSNVQPPLGFESRILSGVRGRQRRPVWIWTAGLVAAAAMAIAFVVVLNRPMPSAPPLVGGQIGVPTIEHVALAPSIRLPKAQSQAPRSRQVEASVRGVPIVAAPITPQEEAVLRLVRNSRAKQLAGLVAKPRDLSKEVDLLQFKEMEIPMLGREEGQ